MPPQLAPSDWLNTDQVAELLYISPQTVNYWVRTNRLRPSSRGRVGVGHRFNRLYIQAFADRLHQNETRIP